MPPQVNRRLLELPQSATVALADRVRLLRAQGREIIPLQTGDPDFPTPAPIVEAAERALRDGQTHYSFSRGLPELREAISSAMERYGAHYQPDTEILATCGGVHAYYCGLQAIVNDGDEVLVPDPSWMTHVNMLHTVRGVPVRVPGLPEDNFFPTLDAWEEACSDKTVALVINSPNNPTGCVATRRYLEDLLAFAQRHNLYVISDEVYDHILFDGRQHTCFASLPEAHERTILINSLSKTYAMTGWRIGWLAAPPAVVSQALKAVQNSITNVAPFIQSAAVFALTDPEMQAVAQKMAHEYQRRKDMVLRLWGDTLKRDIRPGQPQGAFYIFWDMRMLGHSSQSLSERLLADAGIALVPGDAFGACGEGYVRMTLAASETALREAVERLGVWVQQQL